MEKFSVIFCTIKDIKKYSMRKEKSNKAKNLQKMPELN
jgi:hypothetical protein